ncbi:MAG: hypothetical protein ACYC9L_00285 [Sulfuricaulis sp.]
MGGPPGYANFLEAIRQPDHPKHEVVEPLFLRGLMSTASIG